MADDSGRLRGNSRMLASLLYPYDDDVPGLIDGWMQELEKENCIVRYQSEGQSYISLLNWLIHQKIDKPSASKLPEPPGDSTKPREPSRLVVVGREGKGEEGSAPAKRSVRSKLPDPFIASEPVLRWAEEKGHVNLDKHLENFISYVKRNGKTYVDWDAALMGAIRENWAKLPTENQAPTWAGAK